MEGTPGGAVGRVDVVSGDHGVVDIVGGCDLACEARDDRWASTILKTRNHIQWVESRYDDQGSFFASCMTLNLCGDFVCVVKDRPFAYFRPPLGIL